MSSHSTAIPREREMVLCHACHNEWFNDEHGLRCPQCQGEAVEIITPDNDPRSEEFPSFPDYDRFGSPSMPSHPQTPNPMNNHYPWEDPPDPDHEDIHHESFSPAPGVYLERLSVRTGGSRGGQRPARTPADEVFGTFFQALGGFMQGANNQSRPGGPPQARATVFTGNTRFSNPTLFGPPHSPLSPPHSPNQGSRYRRSFHGAWPDPHAGAGRNTWSAEERIFPQDFPRGNGNASDPAASIQAMMQAFFAQIHHNNAAERGPAAGHQEAGGTPHVFGPLEFLRSLADPANAVHGDVAMTPEALDRIVSQMMEQNGGSSAPGPASAAAIAALPKKRVDKTMMGSDGKAECSVCMENVELGDEVTFLPCKHWFHELCVGIWLKEHDTCPHCRQSITPAGPGAPNGPGGSGSSSSNTNNSERPIPRHPTTPAGSSPTTPQPGLTSTNPFGFRPHPGMLNAVRMPPMPPQMQPQMQPLSHPQSPFTQPGMQQPYVPGGYPTYPEPQSYVQLPPQPPLQPVSSSSSASASSSRNPRRHHSSRQSSSRGNDTTGRDRAPSNSSGGGGVTGWFRGLASRSSRNSES